MIDATEAFKQYQPLIEGFTWKATKRYRYLEHEDIKQQAYLIFCEAIERFDPSMAYEGKESKLFCTFLYNRLRTLNDYCNYNTKYKLTYSIDNGSVIKWNDKSPYLKINSKRCGEELFIDYDKQEIEDARFEQFEAAMDRLESCLDLSDDAQELIDFLISREWEIPGIGRVPHLSSAKKYCRYWKGWAHKRTEAAWNEAKDWWQSGNHFLQGA